MSPTTPKERPLPKCVQGNVVPVPKIPTPRLPPARLQQTVKRNEDMTSNRRPPPRPNIIRNVAAASTTGLIGSCGHTSSPVCATVSTSTTGLIESTTVSTQATHDPLCDSCIEHRKKIGRLTECLQMTEGELVDMTSENVRLKRLLAAEKISLFTRGRCPNSVPLYVKAIINVFFQHWVPEKLRDEFATYEFDLPNHGNRQQKKMEDVQTGLQNAASQNLPADKRSRRQTADKP